MYQKKMENDIRCPLEYGLELLGGKWKSRVICVLAAKETLRYNEIRREMKNITDTVLATTLRDLIASHLIERQSFDEVPPRVEYRLTDKGKSAIPVLRSMCQWAGAFYRDHSDEKMVQCEKCDYNT